MKPLSSGTIGRHQTRERAARGLRQPVAFVAPRWSCALAGLAMVLLSSADARADWKSAYAEGYTLARQGKNWETVASRMQEALKEKNDEGSWVNITSGGSQPYLPYFYLGLARFNLGDCSGAVQNWKTSSSFKQFVQHRSQQQQFNELFPVCEKDLAARKELSEGQARRQQIGALSRDADLLPVWGQEPALGPALAKADTELADATKAYEDARTQEVKRRLGLFVDVQAKATQANEHLDAILKTAHSRRDTLAQARQRADEALKSAANAGGGTASGGNAGNANAGTGSTPTLGVRNDPPAGGLGPKVSPPGFTGTTAVVDNAPAALVSGTRHFFSGKYRDALSSLSALDGSSVSSRWQGPSALVRAAAAYALYTSGGRRDKALLQQATAPHGECRRLRPTLEPDGRLYSPAFVRFFREHAPPDARQAVRNER